MVARQKCPLHTVLLVIKNLVEEIQENRRLKICRGQMIATVIHREKNGY
jgi:hypothetical protein